MFMEGKQVSDIKSEVSYMLTSEQVLIKFYEVLKTCAGPLGKFHTVRNSCGGHVTLTSSSSRLLSALSLTRPEVKLVAASVQAHLSLYGDCGLFLACTCLHFIHSSLQISTHFSVLGTLYEAFLKHVTDYISHSDNAIVVKADFNNLNVIMAYVKSVVLSKSFATLSKADCDHVTQLVVGAFIESVPETTTLRRKTNGILVVGLGGKHVKDSCMKQGLLLDYPELPSMQGKVQLNLRTVTRSDGDKGHECSLVKVVLVTCSMSGDLEEVVDAVYEITASQSQDVEDMVLIKMVAFCEELEKLNVGLVICQKVIHPVLKTKLTEKGIYYVDRIGSQNIPYLQDLTGAQPLSTFLMISDLNKRIGYVTSVEHEVVLERSYLLLSRRQCSVVSLVLCDRLEERLAELKTSVMTALHGLRLLMAEQRLLAGGGCWQIHCSQHLLNRVQLQLRQLVKEHGCSQAVVMSALSAFVNSLYQWVYSIHRDVEHLVVDPVHYHCWKLPVTSDVNLIDCCCGLKSAMKCHLEHFSVVPRHGSVPWVKEELKADIVDNAFNSGLVLDNVAASREALNRSVFTAHLILSIDKYIYDNN